MRQPVRVRTAPIGGVTADHRPGTGTLTGCTRINP